MSDLPIPYTNNLPVPSNSRSINRGLAKYENRAYVAMQRERIDQVCFADGTVHSIVLGMAMVDQIGAMAHGDPIKLQVGYEALSNFVLTNNARMQKRWGGAR